MGLVRFPGEHPQRMARPTGLEQGQAVAGWPPRSANSSRLRSRTQRPWSAGCLGAASDVRRRPPTRLLMSFSSRRFEVTILHFPQRRRPRNRGASGPGRRPSARSTCLPPSSRGSRGARRGISLDEFEQIRRDLRAGGLSIRELAAIRAHIFGLRASGVLRPL